MSNSWSKQSYVQLFDCLYITFKKAINIFECMEIAESIYEGGVKPTYLKLFGQIPTMLVKAG